MLCVMIFVCGISIGEVEEVGRLNVLRLDGVI